MLFCLSYYLGLRKWGGRPRPPAVPCAPIKNPPPVSAEDFFDFFTAQTPQQCRRNALFRPRGLSPSVRKGKPFLPDPSPNIHDLISSYYAIIGLKDRLKGNGIALA
jgi:hypothetical protein